MTQYQVGQSINNKFTLRTLLGQGGMGEVWLARDADLERDVALKFILSSDNQTNHWVSRFVREAQSIAQLDVHPNIITIHDINSKTPPFYMAIEYIAGGSLADYIKLKEYRHQLSAGSPHFLSDILYLLEQVAQALDFVHQKGIIHRDIKPDNILLKQVEHSRAATEPLLQAVVTDFGLAKLQEGRSDESRVGGAMGTPDYMSPEQSLGQEVDKLSDIYSLGVVLYQCVTGELPFEADSDMDVMRRHRDETPTPPRTIIANTPAIVEEIIEQAMAKKPEERFQTASAMAEKMSWARQQMMLADSAAERRGISLADMVRQKPPVKKPPRRVFLLNQTALNSDPFPSPPSEVIRDHAVRQTDVLYVSENGQQQSPTPLTQPHLFIGRDNKTCAIFLPSNSVSKQHARLDFIDGQWHITDLHSTNGTFLAGDKLPPDKQRTWPAGTWLTITPFLLRWEPAESDEEVNPTPVIGIGNIDLEPSTVVLSLGSEKEITLTIIGLGDASDQPILTREGRVPDKWFTDFPQEKQLDLDVNGQAKHTFKIVQPTEDRTPAGDYPYDIFIKSRNSKVTRTVSGLVQISPFYAFEWTCRTKKLTNKGMVTIEIANSGNTPETFTVVIKSDSEIDQMVRFSPAKQREIEIPAGESRTIKFQLVNKKRPLAGESSTKKFDVSVEPFHQPSGGKNNTNTHSVELEITPIVPQWVHKIPLRTIVMGILLLIVVFLFMSSDWRDSGLSGFDKYATAWAEEPPDAGCLFPFGPFYQDSDGDGEIDGDDKAPCQTSTPTPTATPTPTFTPSATPTLIPTSTPIPTPTPNYTATAQRSAEITTEARGVELEEERLFFEQTKWAATPMPPTDTPSPSPYPVIP